VGRELGFHADDADITAAPGGDAADQAAAADRHEDGVDRAVRRELASERSLPEQRLALIEGMHFERARLARVRL
jgi:hypothetical protein